MSKFVVVWATGNEQCVNCGRTIKGRHIQLIQNRYAKPRCCKSCLKEKLEEIETGKEVETEQKTNIIFEINPSLNQNSQFY